MPEVLNDAEWQRLQEIVEIATTLPAEERVQYIDNACASCPTLRPQVEAMLAAFDDPTINTLLISRTVAATVAGMPSAGERLGPYRLLEIVGRGGMGVVYRAIRDDDEYHKEVAIKIASGHFSPELRQRFLHERQILANLEHPSIARLLDGGTTPDGLPYVVMEFVSGKPIDQYCREANSGRGLSQRHKIELVIQLANAVEYAHRHLVVHRDLKPDNIHVTDEGIPKLLDFGIAKALDPQASGVNSGLTIDTARLMTPEYASPEQVRAEAVTTMTDVYQIGLLLYQLLTGKRPFQSSPNMSMGELERMICNTQPPKPQIDRDLDQVVLHALEKDPRQRYASAGKLAEDLERYLHGFPVQARPVPMLHRVGKFVRRNKAPVAAASALVFLLVGFVFALSIEVGRAKQQRDRANQQRDSANQIANFLVNIFSASDPSQARGRNISARELLDRGAQSIQEKNQLDPEVKDRLLETLGTSYESLGAYQRSLDLYEQLLQFRRQRYGEHSKEYAAALGRIAHVDMESERYSDMMNVLPRWVELTREVNGVFSPETENALSTLALNYALQGDFRRAESTAQQVLTITRKLTGDRSPQTLGVDESLGLIQEYRGEDDLAEASYRTVLNALQKGDWRNSENVVRILDIRGKLGYVLTEEGRYQEAESLLQNIVPMEQKILGAHTTQVADVEVDVGFLDASIGKFQEAEQMMNDAIAIQAAVLGTHSLYLGGTYDELARVYIFEGKYALAKPLIEKALPNLTQMTYAAGARHEEEHPVIARVLRHLAIIQLHQHQLAKAEQTVRRALKGESAYNSPTSPYAAQDYQTLGEILEAEGKPAEAELDLRRAFDIYRTTAQSYLPGRASTLEDLGELLLHEHRNTQAKPVLMEAAAILQKELPSDAPALRQTRRMLASAGR